MNILKNSEQACVPVNQPAPNAFPYFYLIPQTSAVHTPRPASNDPTFHQCSPTRINPPKDTLLHKFLRQEKEILQETCADGWAALKQAGRNTVRFLARWVILPLSVASMFWIPIGNPAALPL